MTSLLLNWVLTASLLIAVVVLLRVVFGKHISARLRYALWAVALVRLLIPAQLYTAPVETPRVLPAVRTIQTLPNITPEKEERPAQNTEAAMPAQTIPAPDSETAPSAPEARKPLDPWALLGGVWVAGTALAALALLWSNLRFTRRLRRVRVPLATGAWEAASAPLAGTDCPLRVYIAEGLPSPCLFGIIRPAVYLTPEAAADPTMLRHVLVHEITHYRHGDHIWSVLRCAALAIHWWNPLVWVAAVLSRRDAELACDEGALKRLGDSERSAYGGTLLALVTAKPRPGDMLCCATTMTGAKRSLRERIGRIAHAPKRWLWAAVLAVVLSALVCACAFARTEKKPEDRPLTQEELDYFNSEVFNGVGFNMRNQFLFLAVEAPGDYKEIDLYQLFYNGTGKPGGVSEEERQTVVNAAWGGEDPGVDLIKCPAKEMDEVLREHLGLSLEDMDKLSVDGFTYLPEYDAYYTLHGDTNYMGNITFVWGEYQDGNIRLYYQTDFLAQGGGWPVLIDEDGGILPAEEWTYACVTLEEQKDGGYHFLSNWKCDPPAIPTAYPAWAPELVIPLDGLEPYEPLLSMEPDTVSVDTMGEILCRDRLPDGTEVVCYWEPDHLTNPEHEYTKYWAIRRGDSLLRFCKEDDAYTFGYAVRTFRNVLGQEGFRIECPRGAAYDARDYYVFDGNGVPRLFADCANNVVEVDLNGDGENELLWDYHGGGEAFVYFRRDGALYLADIKALIHSAWPETEYIWFGLFDPDIRYPDIRYISFTAQVPIPGANNSATAFRTLWFDGVSLLLYKDETPYTDHVKEGVVAAPMSVLTVAKNFVQDKLDALAEEGYGADGSGKYDEENFGPGNVVWDDWRITALNGPYYETAGDLTVEIWNLGYETHTTTPERVMIPGGSYRGEDGWCMIGYPDCDYLYFLLDENGNRTFLYARMENDCAPGTDMFRADMIRDLEAGGFLSSLRELTLVEYQTFGYYFSGKDMDKLHNGLLRVAYDSYQDIGPNLAIVLYDQGEPITDESEREEAAKLCGGLEMEHTKFSTEHLRQCLAANFQNPDGLDWLDLGVDLTEALGPYSEKYDAYYMEHSDILMDGVRFDYGERYADGTVRLYYETNLWYLMEDHRIAREIPEKRSMCATLVPDPSTEGNWLMVSNSIVP